MDADEQQAIGKQTIHGSNAKTEQKKSDKTEKASSTDKAASNLTGTTSQASGSDDSKKSKKKKGKGKDSQDDKDKGQKQGSSQAGTANAKPQCQLCNLIGHTGTQCRKFTLVKNDGSAGKQSAQNASDGGKKSEFICYRCKKPNHVARNCHQTVDVNGQPLEPVNNAAAGSKPSTSNAVASAHLNATGGARTESAAHTPMRSSW
jgi:hypothetical protein